MGFDLYSASVTFDGQGHGQVGRRYKRSGFAAPFGGADGSRCIKISKPRIFEFFGCFKAVKIKVIDFEPACFISFQQRKGRAFDCTRPAESAKHRADQTCLARTKIALQTHGQS